METDKKGSELLNKLALLTEAAQDITRGKVSIIFEVNRDDFFNLYSMFEQNLGADNKQFKVEISGTDFIFLLDE
jgi:hypothetical protein